jgi:hypothetical protein
MGNVAKSPAEGHVGDPYIDCRAKILRTPEQPALQYHLSKRPIGALKDPVKIANGNPEMRGDSPGKPASSTTFPKAGNTNSP